MVWLHRDILSEKEEEREMDGGLQGGEDAGHCQGQTVWESFKGVGKQLKKFFCTKKEEFDCIRQELQERDEASQENRKRDQTL